MCFNVDDSGNIVQMTEASHKRPLSVCMKCPEQGNLWGQKGDFGCQDWVEGVIGMTAGGHGFLPW